MLYYPCLHSWICQDPWSFKKGSALRETTILFGPQLWKERVMSRFYMFWHFLSHFLRFALVTSLLHLVIWHLCAWHTAMLASLMGNMVACGSLAVDMVLHAQQIFLGVSGLQTSHRSNSLCKLVMRTITSPLNELELKFTRMHSNRDHCKTLWFWKMHHLDSKLSPQASGLLTSDSMTLDM